MILQRASAGSGKTFKLAKTYIRLFISQRDEESGRYVLLPAAGLRESHSHILGVTFTNKATNEMKERIVSKLASLAVPHPEPGKEPADWRAPDYLLDFTGERPGLSEEDDILFTPEGKQATRADITRACRTALRVLLNDYGHFNISTIDTFFQGVLRTFAYELRLNDNYHVELNDDYLAQVGVDHTLSMVNTLATPGHSGEEQQMGEYVHNWARTTIQERLARGDSWNMFNKSSGAGVYADLLDLAKKMNKESFKLKAALLDDYFSDISRFDRFYDACREAAGGVRTLFATAAGCFNRLNRAVEEAAGGDASACWNGMKGAWDAIRALRPYSKLNPSKLGTKLGAYYCAEPPEFDGSGRKHFLKKDCKWRDDERITDLFRELGRSLFLWQEERAYRDTVLSRLHYMGLLHFIRHNSELFRNDNNLIPLSATNEILRRIISRDDTPFIYERIGSRLNHYLLDEFQDTSVMQWANLRPLLEQSTDTGQECLIIGDAKQSIYRFRNAEPDIINNRVARALPSTRILPSPSAPLHERARMNANYRSSAHVVRTNNSIFTLLPALLDNSSEPYLQRLYEGAVQQVVRSGLAGYVHISFDTPIGWEYAELSETPENKKKACYDYLGFLVDDLRERGYRLSDIALLTDRNSDGAAAIAALMEHNKAMTAECEDYKPIEILSEESLKVGDSAAVKVILAVLGAIARGFRHPEEPADAKAEQRPVQIRQYELAQFVANFHCYFAAHRDEPLDSILKRDLDSMLPPDEIQAMLSDAATSTLPAIVEAIAARFTTTLGGEQAAYVAAFQDAVLEYCESYPADIASFLGWWEENGKNCAIAAPEGVDALRVMTIHKSKGLEFDVVIIPKADWNPCPSASDVKRELIWTDHIPRGLKDLNPADIPPFIPVTPSLEMANPESPFHEAYAQYEQERIVDQLNKTYVAFTRAVRELHVYAPVHSGNRAATQYIGDYLRDALGGLALPAADEVDPSLLLTAGNYTLTPELFETGEPTLPLSGKSSEASEQTARPIDRDVIIIDNYARPGRPANLHTLPEE